MREKGDSLPGVDGPRNTQSIRTEDGEGSETSPCTGFTCVVTIYLCGERVLECTSVPGRAFLTKAAAKQSASWVVCQEIASDIFALPEEVVGVKKAASSASSSASSGKTKKMKAALSPC